MASISFIIPSYNYAEYIGSAIESIVPVLMADDEIIVIDDGSTDDTRQVMENWKGDNRVQYVYQDNAGVSAARNSGARRAKNDYLYFLDADDRILIEGFRLLRKEADAKPEKSMVFGGHCSVDGEAMRCHRQQAIGNNTQNNFLDYVITRKISIANGGAVLIKRNIALHYPYPENLKVSEDFCVYAWIMANEPVAAIENEIVAIYKHDSSLRNQVDDYAGVVENLPDILFDPKWLSKDLMPYKQQFFCNRLLSLFRAQYLSGQYRKARKTYRKAIRCRFVNLFKIVYLRKYLRCLFK